ncbi:MAG TPA: amino acid permease, partial [Kofleriaceae bacterium]|nr:amino acid permease [Kofleriaceae bacterium]
WGGALAALPFAIWFYLAIEGVANVAEEAKDPQRVIPRGFLSAMLTLVALTAITLFGAVGVGGWHHVVYPAAGSLETSDSPLPLAIAQVISRDSPVFTLMTGVGLIGLLASFHGILIAGSRATLEFGRAGYAPRILGEVNPKTRTPVAALLGNMVIGLIVLATGQTNDIILVTVFGALTLYILSSAAVLQLRRREPELARPYRTPLYPVTPIVALVLSVGCVIAMAWSQPKLALLYAAMLAGSWILFAVFVPKNRRTRF